MLCCVVFVTDMESVSVLVTCDANTFGMFVPMNSSFEDPINLLSLELDINNNFDELEISHSIFAPLLEMHLIGILNHLVWEKFSLSFEERNLMQCLFFEAG